MKRIVSVGPFLLISVSLVLAGCDRSTSSSQPAETSDSQASGKPRCVVLEHPGVVMAAKEVYQPMPFIARELLRQALLISARDELGMATRDSVLRESGGPPGKGNSVLRLVMTHSVADSKTVGFSIRRQQGAGWVPIADGKAPFVREEAWDYVSLIAEAERLSRTSFCDALRSAGVVAASLPKANDEPLPDEVEKNLWSLNTIDQFAAVRELHHLMRTRGESREVLGGLARGYANLGVLTEMHWNVSHKVFKARGLLYAQRLLVRDSQSPFGLAHRAYALALAGRHVDGLADAMEARRRLARAVKGPLATTSASVPADEHTRLPAWLDMVEATCQCDGQKLMEMLDAHEVFSGWAYLLCVLEMDVGFLSNAGSQFLVQLVSNYPDCLRGLSMLNRSGKLEHQHVAGPAAFEELDRAIRERLPEIADLPPEIRDLVVGMSPLKDETASKSDDGRAARVSLVKGLLAAGEPRKDRGEPSWMVLGHVVEEEFFDHIQERAYFLRGRLAVDSAEFVDWAVGLVPDHPYRGYVEQYRYRRGHEKGSALANLRNIRMVDLDFQITPVFNWFDFELKSVDPKSPVAGVRSMAGSDMVVRDLMIRTNNMSDQTSVRGARALLGVSPKHPVAACVLVRLDWELARQLIPQWDKIHGENPAYLGELARHYYREGPPEVAEAALKKVIEFQPEIWAYRWLATLYKYRGQEDKYVETLEEALRVPDAGLEHTGVAIALSGHYRLKKDWDNALEYARRAAQSHSEAGLLCLARCYEAMGRLDDSEEWMERSAERYPNGAYKWYVWCRIHGRGNEEKARRMCEACFNGRNYLGLNDHSGVPYALYLTVAGRSGDALEVYRRLFEHNSNPILGLHAALLHDEMNRAGARDDALKQVIEKGGRYRLDGKPTPEPIELARMFQAALAGKASLDDKAIAKLIETGREGLDTDIAYLVACFLEKRDPARAREYLLRAARSEREEMHSALLARYRAVKLGIPLATQPATQTAPEEDAER